MNERITEPKFKHRLLAAFFVRFHMTLILGAVCLSGVITSKMLLSVGFTWMPMRFAIAIIAAYAIFFLMVRLWLSYIGISPRARTLISQARSRKSRSGSSSGGGVFDFGSSGGSGSGSSWGGFGGGSGGGGGASESWGDAAPDAAWLSSSEPLPSSGVGSFNLGSLGSASSGSSGGGFDLDLGDDGCLAIVVLLLLIALILGIFGAGAYLIYQAPAIFGEAAFQAALASGLIKASRGIDNADWKGSVFRATWIPFIVILILAVAFGGAAHRYCPAATRIAEIFTACKRVE